MPTLNWQQSARHIGTQTHRVLQQLVINRSLYGELESFVQFHPAWRNQLKQLGVPDAQCDEAVNRVEQLLCNTLADATGRWILDPTHQQSECELPISFNNGFQTLHLIIDRTFVDKRGVRWIIDYKTAEVGEGESFAEFLNMEEKRYRKQLTLYSRALRAMSDEPVRAGLYFPESSYFHEIAL
mgnify:CR=1 FL=1